MQKKNRNKTTTNKRGSSKTVGNLRSKDKKAISNDPGWYSVDPVLLNDAASIPFGHPAGVGINTTSHGAGRSGSGYIPGIMALSVAHTIGNTDRTSDPVNMAAMQSYTFIRHANSGSANYEAGDLMLYYLAMAEIYSYIEYLKRAYGVARVYAQRNRYLPDTILSAMRIQPKSVFSDLSAFRYGLNLIINKAASFAVPNTMSLFARRAFLYQGIYTEGSSIKDQLYMYIPAGFYHYEWQDGKLEFNKLTGSNPGTKTIMEHLEMLNTMVDKVIANEDMGIMNGDIIKAYGDNIIKLSHLDAEYTVAPAYDPLVLEQMQNATILSPGMIDLDSLEIISDYSGNKDLGGVSIVKQRLAVEIADLLNVSADKKMDDPVKCEKFCEVANLTGEQLLTTMLPEPTPSDVIEITRMMASLSEFDNTYGPCLSTGTEVCVGLEIWTKPNADGAAVLALRPNLLTDFASSKSVAISTENSNVIDNIAAYAPNSYGAWAASGMYQMCNVANRANFKFAPLIYLYAWEDINEKFLESPSYQVLASHVKALPAARFIGNISNFTSIDESELYKMHSCAIMNEFATPHLAIK